MPKITKKRLLAASGVTLVLVIYCFSRGRKEPFTEERIRELRVGMTRSQVESMFGPAGDYSTGPTRGGGRFVYLRAKDELSERVVDEICVPDGTMEWHILWLEFAEKSTWVDDCGSFTVRFNDDGIAVGAQFTPIERLSQSPLDNFLWRGKRQWRRWFPDG